MEEEKKEVEITPLLKLYLDQIDQRLSKIESALENLKEFRWKMMGSSKVISGITAFGVSVATILIGKLISKL